MKNIIILAIFMVLLTFLSACSTNDISALDSNNNLGNSEINNVIADDTVIETQQKNINLAKMKYCYSKPGEPVVYTYYIADDAIYIKIETGNSGFIEKVVKAGEICTKSPDQGFESWNCIQAGSGSLNDEKEAAEMQTAGPLKDVFGFKCSTIDYDTSKFDTN